MLYDASLSIQQTDFSIDGETASALKKVRQVVNIFDAHAMHEEQFILPAIRQYEPSLVDAFELEHIEDHTLTEKLRGLLSVYSYAIKTEVKIETGRAITRSFEEFMIFNLQHMTKEETVLNKVLWRYYTDSEIQDMSKRIVSSLPHEEAAITSAWMMRGMSNTESGGRSRLSRAPCGSS